MNKDTTSLLLVAGIIALLLFGGGKGCDIPGGDTALIPDPGLRVLATFNATPPKARTVEQQEMLDSTTLRSWLDANCTKDAKGTPEWRIVPSIVQFGNDQPIWQKLMGLPRAQPDWLIVNDGKHGTSIPLPPNEAEAMKILTPYGGGK